MIGKYFSKIVGLCMLLAGGVAVAGDITIGKWTVSQKKLDDGTEWAQSFEMGKAVFDDKEIPGSNVGIIFRHYKNSCEHGGMYIVMTVGQKTMPEGLKKNKAFIRVDKGPTTTANMNNIAFSDGMAMFALSDMSKNALIDELRSGGMLRIKQEFTDGSGIYYTFPLADSRAADENAEALCKALQRQSSPSNYFN